MSGKAVTCLEVFQEGQLMNVVLHTADTGLQHGSSAVHLVNEVAVQLASCLWQELT